MAEEGKMREERTPILGREMGKPLRPEEYPTEQEIASLPGEVGKSRLETVLRTMGLAAPVLTVPILAACQEIPETPPIVRTPEEVGLTPSPTLEIKTPTPEVTPIEKITPSPTVTKEPTVTPEPTPTPTAEKPTPTKEPTPIPEPTPKPVEMVATGNVDIYLSPDGQKVGYFIPGQRFTPTGKEQNGWIQVVTNGNTLWIQEGGPYGPAGEVEPPAPACEVPHWPERTPGRKTGVQIMFGTPYQTISPDRPYIMQYWRQYIGGPWYTRRDARIIAIDRENQIITFQLSDGSTRQRKVTPNTIVIMDAHEVYRGMSASEWPQSGGNLCDLELDDAISILHPNEPESANPNPGLTDLFGLFIVQ